MESLLGVDRYLPYADRIGELIRYRIALWDVIAACHREVSADNHIKDPVFNPLKNLLESPRQSMPLCSTVQLLHGMGPGSGLWKAST